MFFPQSDEGGKYLGILSIFAIGIVKGCKGRLGTTSVSDIFCIYLVREILFLSGKSHRILKSDVYHGCLLTLTVLLLPHYFSSMLILG